jgi:hypothetical protein
MRKRKITKYGNTWVIKLDTTDINDFGLIEGDIVDIDDLNLLESVKQRKKIKEVKQ